MSSDEELSDQEGEAEGNADPGVWPCTSCCLSVNICIAGMVSDSCDNYKKGCTQENILLCCRSQKRRKMKDHLQIPLRSPRLDGASSLKMMMSSVCTQPDSPNQLLPQSTVRDPSMMTCLE